MTSGTSVTFGSLVTSLEGTFVCKGALEFNTLGFSTGAETLFVFVLLLIFLTVILITAFFIPFAETDTFVFPRFLAINFIDFPTILAVTIFLFAVFTLIPFFLFLIFTVDFLPTFMVTLVLLSLIFAFAA